jgi:hypothetical protein
MSCRLARSIVYGMGRRQTKLEFRQAFLGHLVDIAAELYAVTCACVRAQMLIQDGAPEASGAVDLTDLLWRGSRRRVDRLFHDLMHTDDAHNYATAQRVLEGRFLSAEAGMIDPSGEGPMVGLQQRGKPPPVDLPSRAQSGGRREEVDDPFVCCQGSPPHHQKE